MERSQCGHPHIVFLEGIDSGMLTQFTVFSGTTLQHLLHLFTTTMRGNGSFVFQFGRIPNWLLSFTGWGARTTQTIRGKTGLQTDSQQENRIFGATPPPTTVSLSRKKGQSPRQNFSTPSRGCAELPENHWA